LILPAWAAAAAPSASGLQAELTTIDEPIVLRQDPLVPRDGSPGSERRFGRRLIEARQVLLELQAFVAEAARTVELGRQLKSRRLENERLRRLLRATEAARRTYEVGVTPAQALVARLTRTIVENWLETVRLQHRTAEADRDLDASEQDWRKLEERLSALRHTFAKRRAELLALQAESAALSVELQRTRQLADDAHADAQRVERQQDHIAEETRRLRRDINSKLRAVLLHDGDP
jgi:chromosome segregation ATPase